jgi:hypothetical protein
MTKCSSFQEISEYKRGRAFRKNMENRAYSWYDTENTFVHIPESGRML